MPPMKAVPRTVASSSTSSNSSFRRVALEASPGNHRGRLFVVRPAWAVILAVEVLPRAGHSERREAQLRRGNEPWGGRVDRIHEPMYKNRIQGAADQGERANNREALVVQGQAS